MVIAMVEKFFIRFGNTYDAAILVGLFVFSIFFFFTGYTTHIVISRDTVTSKPVERDTASAKLVGVVIGNHQYIRLSEYANSLVHDPDCTYCSAMKRKEADDLLAKIKELLEKEK